EIGAWVAETVPGELALRRALVASIERTSSKSPDLGVSTNHRTAHTARAAAQTETELELLAPLPSARRVESVDSSSLTAVTPRAPSVPRWRIWRSAGIAATVVLTLSFVLFVVRVRGPSTAEVPTKGALVSS